MATERKITAKYWKKSMWKHKRQLAERALAVGLRGAPGVERSETVGAAGRKRRGVTVHLDQGRSKACVQCPRVTA